MTRPEADYLKNQLRIHYRLFFKEEIEELSKQLQFIPYEKAVLVRGHNVVIPFDLTPELLSPDIYSVDFNYTKLTLYNKIQNPDSSEWSALPNENCPIWYQHTSGTLIPAFDLFGNLFSLLSFTEEKQIDSRDTHGRFSAYLSPRDEKKLLEIPVFNEAAAVLAAALIGVSKGTSPLMSLNSYLKPPVAVLSHDCDVLYGDDLWTQLVRLYRIILPLSKFKLPRIDNLWWVFRNAVTPERYYFDNIQGMIELEKSFGFNSTFYMINGTYGRFGMRSGLEAVKKASHQIKLPWNIGMHYNYDTFLNDEIFSTQKRELENTLEMPVDSGRAHYLKFDSQNSFQFLIAHGIEIDESIGFADKIGYRAGIGGCFQPYNWDEQREYDIWEIPMIVMDATIVSQYKSESINRFQSLVTHLSHIGGAVSIVFHPGQFFNPEHKQMLGIYHKMLIALRNVGARSKTAADLLQEVKK